MSWRSPVHLMSGATAATMAADAPPLILEHLTTADGLPQGTVYTTLQDSQGFIWLGTEDGLVRYDGHELVRYAYSRDARNSLPGNFVYELARRRPPRSVGGAEGCRARAVESRN